MRFSRVIRQTAPFLFCISLWGQDVASCTRTPGLLGYGTSLYIHWAAGKEGSKPTRIDIFEDQLGTSVVEHFADGSTRTSFIPFLPIEAAIELVELDDCMLPVTTLSPDARPAATSRSLPPSGHAAQDFTARDLNGDGAPDLVSISRNSLLVALQDNSGNQIGGSNYALPGNGTAVIAADLNGDGKLDLVVSMESPPGGVAVLLGNGNGTFQQPKTYGSTTVDVFSVTAGDFNGDGKTDLAFTTCSTGNGITVLLGNGDGSFKAPVNYAAGSCPGNLVALDVNRDGKSDLVISDGELTSVFVLLGRGDGTFNAPLASPANGSGAADIAYTDLNGDGIPDLGLAMGGMNTVAILLGKGDGTFQPPAHYAVGADPESLALLPLADGNFLALTEDRAAEAMVVTPGTLQGTLATPVVQFVPAASEPALADATGDGKPDILLVGQRSSPNLVVLPGDGTGNFGAPVSFPLNAPDGYFPAGDIVIGDFNRDGIADVVLPVGLIGLTSANVGIGVMLGKKGGGFQAMNVTALSDSSLGLALGDFNNDGKLDAAVRSASGISLLLGNGDGTFKGPVQTAFTAATTPGGVLVGAIAAGDFNRDGKLDLFVVGTTGPVVLPGNGNGGFGAPIPVTVTSGLGVTSVVAADLNGDGILDAVVADVNSGTAASLLGKGDGTFRAAVPVAIDTNPFRLALVDWNGDGYPDLAIAHGGGTVEDALYLNNRDGTFGNAIHLPSGPSPLYLSAGDLTGAGNPGIVSVANAQGIPGVAGAVTVVASSYSASPPLLAIAASPAAGNSASQKFTFTFQDSAGYQNLAVVDVLINNALDGRHACYIAFVPSGALSGSVLLVDDAGDAGGPFQSLSLPGGGSISNSQCTISGSGSSVTAGGNRLSLTLAITFTAFSGNKVFYTSARDAASNNSGWQALGTWAVPGAQSAGPAVGGVTPSSGNSLLQTYQFVFTDTNGWQDIAVANILVNSAIDGRHACYLAFVPTGAAAGNLYLVDDGGDAAGPYTGLTLPGQGTVNNSQCVVAGSGASVSGSGNTLTLTLPVAFNPGFLGNQVFFLATRSNTANSGWQAVGTVTVP